MFNGRRQPSRGGTSRMMREYQVRICERLGVKFPGPTRQSRPKSDVRVTSALPHIATKSRTSRHVGDGPNADIMQRNNRCQPLVQVVADFRQ